jgi:hypothetical protein
MSRKLTLDNKRQLKSREILREGDVYTMDNDNEIYSMGKISYGRIVAYYPNSFKFYRRRHTAKKTPSFSGYHLVTKAKKVVMPKESIKKANVAIVNFVYNGKHRVVQVISFNDNYLKGLEITSEYYTRKSKYQFKSFLRSKIKDGLLALAYYGPTSKKD